MLTDTSGEIEAEQRRRYERRPLGKREQSRAKGCGGGSEEADFEADFGLIRFAIKRIHLDDPPNESPAHRIKN